jgi:hypothetical protein
MAEAGSNKRQSLEETSDKIKRRSITNGSHHNTQRYQMELWYGFVIMEELACNVGHTTQVQKSAQANIEYGIPPAKALELATASIAFPRMAQRAWPYARLDNTPGQQFHLTQIPFDVQIDIDTGLALTYQIFVHFEKPTKEYVSAKITQLTAARLTLMGIQTGDILEPIAPLCSTKPSKPWNGMIKLHLKSPTTDGQQLLEGKRIFPLALDGELKVAKIAKGYAATAYNDQLTVKIEENVLKDEPGSNIISKIIEASFRRGQEIEIAQIHKVTGESKAFLIATTLCRGDTHTNSNGSTKMDMKRDF